MAGSRVDDEVSELPCDRSVPAQFLRPTKKQEGAGKIFLEFLCQRNGFLNGKNFPFPSGSRSRVEPDNQITLGDAVALGKFLAKPSLFPYQVEHRLSPFNTGNTRNDILVRPCILFLQFVSLFLSKL